MELLREKGSPPLYYQIEMYLMKLIEDGEFEDGDIFYTENQLEEMFDVSRVTVRQAIGSLSQKGYLVSKRGIGTTVSFTKINENMKRVISFSEEMKQHNIIMTTGFCEVSIVKAKKHVAMNLNITEGDNVFKLDRLRNVNNEPMVYSTTYLILDYDYPLEPSNYENSLYEFLKKTYNVTITSGQDTLEAIGATEPINEYLGVEPNTPLFKRTRKTKDQNDKTIEYSICYYPGNKYKYTVGL